MISFLTGRLVTKGATFAVLEVGGVGLRLLMSTGSLASLPAEGDTVTVHTHLLVREDELTLYAFENETERSAFEALLSVSGVGPKVALSVLSALDPDSLAAAVASADVALMSSVPGVGKKTAQRIIVDLADKLGGVVDGSSGVPGSSGAGAALAQATDALLAMGFSAAEAAAALKGSPSGDSEAVLRYALQRLGGRT